MGHALNKRERIEETELLLQNSQDGLSIYDLAASLDCHPSTAHRYLDEIRSFRNLTEVRHGRYRLDPSETLSNVRLHPAEALTIYLALRHFIRQTSKAPDFMISAIQKVVPALQRPALIDQMTRSNEQLRIERRATLEFTKIFETLIRGWLEGIVVHIHYRNARSDAVIEYDIEPYLFEPTASGDGIYVIVWSHRRDALRTLKIDRIERAMLTTLRFEKPALDINAMLRNAWGIWYGDSDMTRVELLFQPAVAQRLMETVFIPTETKTRLPDGSVLWAAEVNGMLEILSWIRGWGGEVTVIAPDELREQVVRDLHSTLALYKGE